VSTTNTPDEWDDIRSSTDFAKQPVADTSRLDPLLSVVGLDTPTEEQMLFYYDNPHLRPRGETTHYPALDAHFKWMPGYLNVLTAWANDGKSELYRALLLPRAALDGKKSLVWAPEDMPREAYYDALIHSLTGQNPASDGYKPLPRLYYQRAMAWVREYFYVVQFAKGQGKTPGHIRDVFEAARVKLGISHFGLDPWHKADHSGMTSAGGIAPYLMRELGAFTDWSIETGSYLHIIANPKGKTRVKGEAREVPDSDMISGGMGWDDLPHTIMAGYRPQKHVCRNNPAFAIYVHKIKSQRRMGAVPGSIGDGSENPDVLVTFDSDSARYLINGSSPLSDPRIQAIYAPELASPAPARPANSFPVSNFENEPPASPLGTPGLRFGTATVYGA
jgi:hypothetical protein